MAAYYNEHDPSAAAWLRELIKAGHIAPGEVDERDIRDVRPDDLRGFVQCHFFAGIGVWSYALRCAGWPDDRPVWTGSCPCQPFSAAGKGGGFDDERHLWPDFFWLIRQGKPRSVPVFGEQVASKDGLAWLDLVQADLEGEGYAVGAVDICAAGVGAPHIRQRLYWVADASGNGGHDGRRVIVGRAQVGGERTASIGSLTGITAKECCHVGIVADTECPERRPRAIRRSDDIAEAPGRVESAGGVRECGEPCDMGDSDQAERGSRVELASGATQNGTGLRARASQSGLPDGLANPVVERCAAGSNVRAGRPGGGTLAQQSGEPRGPTGGFWRDAEWIYCRDEKWRAVESGSFPLAYGAPERVGRLRGYGNAIVSPCAQAFVEAYLDGGGLT